MIHLIAPERGQDEHGSGAWDAPRGGRRHKAIDYAAAPGSQVLARHAGRVTKLGYPYGSDLSIRYVEITDHEGYQLRYFYVEPADGARVGDRVEVGDLIGTVQSLQHMYPKITDHVHLEILDQAGEPVNPEDWAAGLLA